MPGVSKYENRDTIGVEEISYEDVRRKFNAEPMSAKEFIVFLSHERGLKPNETLNEKTLRGYIRQLCERSEGLLSPDDFKDGKSYSFKPKYHSLLLTLLNTEYFGSKIREEDILNKMKMQKQVAENITDYLKEDVQKSIKKDPAYLNALLADKLSNIFLRELRTIVHTMYNADPIVQYQFMIEGIDRLVGIRRWMNEWEERMRLIRMEFATSENEIQDAINRKGKYEGASIDRLIIRMLAASISGEEYEFVSDNEEISFATAYIATEMYDVLGRDDLEISLIFKELEKRVSDDDRYRLIMGLVRRFFPEDSYLSDKVLTSFSKVVKSQLVADASDKALDADEYNRMVRFIEDAFKEKKEEIYKTIDSKVDVTLTQEVLDEIMAIKDRVEKRSER